MYFFGDTSNSITTDTDAPCIKPDKYCSVSNESMQIQNPRVVLLENLRQSCVYMTYSLDIFWTYMMNFSELCADINNPTFNEDCAHNVLALVGADKEQINQCMKNLVGSKIILFKNFI